MAGLPSFESNCIRHASPPPVLSPEFSILNSASESMPFHGSMSPMGRLSPITAYSLATCHGAFPLR